MGKEDHRSNLRKKFLNRIKIFLPIARAISHFSARLTSILFSFQRLIEWGGTSNPEHFDHYLDLYLQWPREGSGFFTERGVWASLAIDSSLPVLDLCCGDGFFSKHFYCVKAPHISAVDFEPQTIRHAQRFNAAPNIDYRVMDIRDGLPEGPFGTIIWDAAIEHFTESEIQEIVPNIANNLSELGILAGYTILEKPGHGFHLHQHEYEFKSKEDLARFFSPHFKNELVLQGESAERTNLYFWASNGALPLDPGGNVLRVET